MTSVFNISQIPHHHHQNSFHNYHHHSPQVQQPQYAPSQQQQQVSGIHIPLQDERHILAERFKTKVCRNFLTQGFCPYESRCMFAHGDAEMRSADMNIRDGLFTEEAIKAFKRAHRMVERAEASAMLPPPPAYSAAIERDSITNAPALNQANALPYYQHYQSSPVASLENESFEQSLYPDTPVSKQFEEEYVEEQYIDDDCESLSGPTAVVDEQNTGNSNSSSYNNRTLAPVYRHNPYSLATPFEVMPVKSVGGMMTAHVMP